MLTLKDLSEKLVLKMPNKALSTDNWYVENYGENPNSYYQTHRDAYYGLDTYLSHQYEPTDLAKYIEDPADINDIIADPSILPYYVTPKELEEIVEKKRRYHKNNYIEMNNYYRQYLGQPPIIVNNKKLEEDSTITFYIRKNPLDPDSELLDEDDKIVGVDDRYKDPITNKTKPGPNLLKPIHELTLDQKRILRTTEWFRKLREKYDDKAKYLEWIGKDTNIIALRDCKPFDVMWYDRTDPNVIKFVSYFQYVRNKFIAAHYSEYDAVSFEFYEPLMCVYLIMATLANFNAELPLDILNNEYNTKVDVYNLFSSYSVPNFDFTLKYLSSIAQRINTLIMKKGTKDGLQEVAKIFDGITIFKYFIVKRPKPGLTQVELANLKNEEKYDLFFYKTPLNVDDPFNLVNDEELKLDYLDVVRKDTKWGYEDNKLENEIKNIDFSWSESKYLSIANKVNIFTFSLEMSYFYRFMLERWPKLKQFKIYIDTVDTEADIMEILTYLQVLVFKKFGTSPDIPDKTALWYMYSIKDNIDFAKIKMVLKEHFRFHSPEMRFNIDSFMERLETASITGVMDTFENNYKVIQYLYDIRRKVRRKEDFEAIDCAIKALTFGEKLEDVYGSHNNLEKFLATLPGVGGKFLIRLSELNAESNPREAITEEITVIINLLRQQVNNIRHKRIVNMLDSALNVYSDLDMLEYLAKIIDFFKSYTQDIIEKEMINELEDITDDFQILDQARFLVNLNKYEVMALGTVLLSNHELFRRGCTPIEGDKVVGELLSFLKEISCMEDYHSSEETLTIIDPDRIHQEVIGISRWEPFR